MTYLSQVEMVDAAPQNLLMPNDGWSEYKKIINTPKIIELTMLLQPQDVQELDFAKPVYLRQWNSYYIIQKISGYRTGKPCKVELLKIEM